MPKLPFLLVFIPHLSRFVSHLKTLMVPGHVWAEPPGRIRVGAGKRANSRGSGAICCGRGATRALEPGDGHRSGAKRRNVGTKLEKITFCGLHNSNYFFSFQEQSVKAQLSKQWPPASWMNRAPSRKKNNQSLQLRQLKLFQAGDAFGFHFHFCWEPEWRNEVTEEESLQSQKN